MTNNTSTDNVQSCQIPVMVSADIKTRKPFRIICTKEYEFEGFKMKVGDIGYHCHGRRIPDNWEKLKLDTYEKNI